MSQLPTFRKQTFLNAKPECRLVERKWSFLASRARERIPIAGAACPPMALSFAPAWCSVRWWENARACFVGRPRKGQITDMMR